jgi:hypothetical protein
LLALDPSYLELYRLSSPRLEPEISALADPVVSHPNARFAADQFVQPKP